VLKYLESVGDANPVYPNVPLTDAETAAILGDYTFGTGATERLTVAKNARGSLVIQRTGQGERSLFHQGARAFIPTGAEAVRIRFDVADGRALGLTVEDGPLVVRAKRLSA
jgi:uncharacterized protein YaiE (UPF0345 family)